MRIDETGITPTELTDYRTQLQNVFKDALGDDLVVDDETPQGQIIGIMALVLTQVDEVAVAVASGLSLGQATGFQIDSLGSLLDIRRIEGERSTVGVTLTGTVGTVIDAGARAKTTAGDEFSLVSQAVIPASGSVAGEMRAVEFGPTTVAVGALTEIITVVSGWTAITNAAAASLGRLAENGNEYRTRYSLELARNAVNTLEAVRSRVLAVEGVTVARVEENTTSTAITVQSVSIAARSIMAVVEGGTDEEVASAIFGAKPAGIATAGSTSADVDHAQGQTTSVSFERVTLDPLAITIEITINSFFPGGAISLMKERCVQWINGELDALPGQFDLGGLGIGDSLDERRLLTPIQSVPGHTVTALSVTLENGGALPAIQELNKRFTLDADDITITVTTS